MAKLITPLVPKQINNAKPKDSTYTLFDGSGLYLEIAPTGSKLWKMKASLNGKAVKLSFGKYPDHRWQKPSVPDQFQSHFQPPPYEKPKKTGMFSRFFYFAVMPVCENRRTSDNFMSNRNI